MKKEELVKIVSDLYIEGHSAGEIVKILSERCPKCQRLPSERTIRRWINKHKAEWDLKRKQREILKVEKTNKDKRTLEEKIEIELDKADRLDYEDLDELQKRYKEIAMSEYKPRAVEIVIQCIKLKKEIREGLKPEQDNTIKVVLDVPDKKIENWEIVEVEENKK